jgi:hypothetical protein
MSNNPMQRISDLEAQNEQLQGESIRLRAQAIELQAENRALREAVQRMPSAEALAEAIGARLVRVEQNLREDFTGKFAASFLLATETITGRIVAVDERQEKIEARQKAFEGRITTHMEQVGSTLNQADEKQVGLLRRFSTALKQHHAKNEQLLAAQEEILIGCQQAAQATAQSAARCATFDQDYAEASKLARREMGEAAKLMQRDLKNFTSDVKERAEEAVEPAMRKLRDLSDSQIEWRIKWSVLGFLTCVIITVAVSWALSPSPYTMIDAARWRNWQAGNFTKEQAGRLNNMLNEIEKENAKKAGEEQQNDPNTPPGQ